MPRKKFDLFLNESLYAYSILKIIYTDGESQDYEYVKVNDEFEKITGLSEEELLTKKLSDILSLFEFSNRKMIYGAYQRASLTNNNVNLDIHMEKPSKWYRLSVFSIDNNYLLSSIVDITREYKQEQEIAELVNVNMDFFCLIDRNGNIRKVNKRSFEILGYNAEELEGQNIFDFLHPDDIEATLNTFLGLYKMHSATSLTNRFRDKRGKYRYIEWYTQSKVGEFACFSARDITEKKLLEDELRNQAIKDELTGLYNRHYFDEIIGYEMEHADRVNELLSIVVLDLDYFKNVNDTWGHPMGDATLIGVAQIIEGIIRDSDVVLRFGGEEFLILMRHTGIQGAVAASEKIRRALEDNTHPVIGIQTASFGVATRMKSESFQNWYKRADNALYKAKHIGRNCVVASDENIDLSVMLEHLVWKSQWNCGNDKIDQQHQEMIESLKKLIIMFMESKDFNQIENRVEQLIAEINSHFLFEQNIMREIQFPDDKEHIKKHKELTAKMTKLKKQCNKGKIRAADFFAFLADEVLIGHLQELDLKFYPYVK